MKGVDQRFVVEVTERVDPAELEQVAQRVGARLNQPPERFAALLEGRLGPVTQPLARAPAEQVAGVFRDAGVRVTVGEVRPSAPLPSTRWLPSPHDTFDREGWHVPGSGREGGQDAEAARNPITVTTTESVPPGRGGSGSTVAERLGSGAREGSVSSVRPGWLEADGARRATVTPWSTAFDRGRSRLRRPLALALALAVIALLVLQLTPALRIGPAGGFEPGLDAYRHARFVAARRQWLPAAEAGDPRAQFMVGYLSEMGLGQPWSNARAAPWYRQAAERGHAQAQARLASLYARGMGVPHDEVAATRWYRAAAQGGLLEAQFELGQRLLYGLGAARDEVAARQWFERVAAAGHPEAATLAELLAR
jgi:hypothetical protein